LTLSRKKIDLPQNHLCVVDSGVKIEEDILRESQSTKINTSHNKIAVYSGTSHLGALQLDLCSIKYLVERNSEQDPGATPKTCRVKIVVQILCTSVVACIVQRLLLPPNPDSH
jgi:hypothetical protein